MSWCAEDAYRSRGRESPAEQPDPPPGQNWHRSPTTRRRSGTQNVRQPGTPPCGDAGEWTVSAGTSTATVAAYEAEVTASESSAAAAALSDAARLGGRFKTPGQAPSLGRILFHRLQEYARHVGHLDVARELIDGETGE
nr:DUF664 domain-containing protein [Streptomyces sp. ICBB 8177]